MIVNPRLVAIRCAQLALAVAVLASPAQAQQPSASAIAMAKEIITLKGSASGFNNVLPRVVDRVKGMLLRTNPMLSKDLNEVSARILKEYGRAAGEPLNEGAKLYASKFTEAELRAILAFYKTPTGKKVINEEPKIIEEAVQKVDAWSEKQSEAILIKFRNEMRKKGHDL